ncbi:unnamed protein product [Adineta steineri]|uniref:BHLH domain-containing protein n=2 Tax=Adineta steineri TaxID=433720 RepID=A0A813TF94_9BILA|nr:unnamed protein product [Adineta steineri]
MSSRIPLQMMSMNTPDYSSIMYEPSYCNCCYYENQDVYMENSYQTFDENSKVLKKKSTRRSKHIPHHLRPQHIVERRNRRERLRVQDVNQAFYTLQQLLPSDSNSTTSNNNQEQMDATRNSSRISKVWTLRKAVDYIDALQKMLYENN